MYFIFYTRDDITTKQLIVINPNLYLYSKKDIRDAWNDNLENLVSIAFKAASLRIISYIYNTILILFFKAEISFVSDYYIPRQKHDFVYVSKSHH